MAQIYYIDVWVTKGEGTLLLDRDSMEPDYAITPNSATITWYGPAYTITEVHKAPLHQLGSVTFVLN